MRYNKCFAWCALVVGMALPGASLLSAADWNGRDLRNDYGRAERMRDDITRDRARLNEDIRCGRSEAAARDARDLARDQRALDAQYRDIRHDQRDWR